MFHVNKNTITFEYSNERYCPCLSSWHHHDGTDSDDVKNNHESESNESINQSSINHETSKSPDSNKLFMVPVRTVRVRVQVRVSLQHSVRVSYGAGTRRFTRTHR